MNQYLLQQQAADKILNMWVNAVGKINLGSFTHIFEFDLSPKPKDDLVRVRVEVDMTFVGNPGADLRISDDGEKWINIPSAEVIGSNLIYDNVYEITMHRVTAFVYNLEPIDD